MKKKLKVGLVFEDSLDTNDGVQQYVRMLGRWLVANGHDVKYLVGETKNADPDIQDRVYSMSRNIKISGNQNTMFLPISSSGKKIQQVLDKEEFDVLHTMMPTNPLMGSRVIRRAGTTPVVGSFHMVGGTWLVNWGATLLGKLQRSTLSRIGTFLSVSEAAKQFEKKHFGLESTVSPNMVDMSKFARGKRQEFLRGKSGTLVFLGRLVERKGAQHLLAAVRVLHAKNQLEGIVVHICGDGDMRGELEEYVQNHQLGGQVIFHGFIDEDEKGDYLASADVVIYPSTGGEAFGIVLIEAMSTGKSVVLGGDNAGYRTVLGGREDLLFDPWDTEVLANKITHYLNDKRAAKDAIAWQTDEVKQYDVNIVAANVLATYYKAIADNSQR